MVDASVVMTLAAACGDARSQGIDARDFFSVTRTEWPGENAACCGQEEEW